MQMTPNYSYLFPRPLFPPQSRSFSLWSTKSLNGCHPTSFERLNPSKTEFIIIGLPAQIKKIPDPSIHLSDNSSSTCFTSDAAVRNLGVTFDPHLSFSNHISNLSRSCFIHIRDLRRIRPMLDFKTASTIATSIVHSKLDYCNSLFLSLDSTQIHRLQLI